MREAYRKTIDEEWSKFSRSQKIAAVVTNALTITRPLLAGVVAWRGRNKNHKWTTTDTALLATAFATDLEGNIARSMDAQTTIGGVLDPFTDKVATTLIEATLVSRGQESGARFGIKLLRDVALSGLRRHVLTKTNGEVSVSAGPSGRANSFFRQAVDIFAASSVGDKHPRTRNSLQIISAMGTVASGVITGRNLFKALKEHRRR